MKSSHLDFCSVFVLYSTPCVPTPILPKAFPPATSPNPNIRPKVSPYPPSRRGAQNASVPAGGRGKSSRSAYQLRDKDGAESFAAAWAAAKFAGRDNAAQIAIERALYGEMVPTFRNGQFTGYKLIHNDRILMAAIRAQDNEVDPGYSAQLESWKRRLEKWEIALRRQAMDLADGTAASAEARSVAQEDNIVWQREMKREERRQHNAEIRAAVRKGMAKAGPPEPRIRML
jgi:hypothetical protein